MTYVRIRTSEFELALRGAESFVLRQLLLLAPGLGPVDLRAIEATPAQTPPPPAEPVAAAPAAPEPPPIVSAEAVPAAPGASPPAVGPDAERDELVRFFRSFPTIRRDEQSEAALLFAYYLQRQEGLSSLKLGDLLRCCMRVGVDSRNFHRSLGVLTRRGLIEEVRRGEAYRISEQGVAAVEEMRA